MAIPLHPSTPFAVRAVSAGTTNGGRQETGAHVAHGERSDRQFSVPSRATALTTIGVSAASENDAINTARRGTSGSGWPINGDHDG
jgi:hypothetical protein